MYVFQKIIIFGTGGFVGLKLENSCKLKFMMEKRWQNGKKMTEQERR